MVESEPNVSTPTHSHMNEQWGILLEGELIRVQDGEEHHVKKGDIWYTPANVPHSVRVLEQRCVTVELFSPPRDEYRLPGKGIESARIKE